MIPHALRPLREEDEPVVKRWLEAYLADHLQWWSKAYGSEPESSLAQLVQRDWNDILEATDSPDRFVRILDRSEPTGVVSARKRSDAYMGFEVGVLSWIYVDAGARGTGAASLLMDAATEWMAEQGLKGRQVYVTSYNQAAVKLYERHGLRTVDYRMLGG